MKTRLLLLGCLAATLASKAETYRPEQLPPSPWMDTEASTNFPCSFDPRAIKDYALAIDFAASHSNNVVVAIGADSDRDGVLGFDETALEVGWDCGTAFARSAHGAVGPVVSGPDTNGIVNISLMVELRRGRSNPEWLYDPSWNLVRVTTRGVDDPRERILLKVTRYGSVFIIR